MHPYGRCRTILAMLLLVAAGAVVRSSAATTTSSGGPVVPAHALMFGAAATNVSGSDITALESGLGRTLESHRV